MKIHIVKKGDTLWEIAKMYGVNFEQLKALNTQLSSPDMIMPGMKIKVPSNAKPVKKEGMHGKEMAKTPYKNVSPKPLPVIKEDEKEKPKMKEQPMHHMPPMKEQPMHHMPPKKEQPIHHMPPMQPPVHQMSPVEQEMYNYTTINFSQMPQMPPQKKEVKQQQQKMPEHMHMVPMCCYPMHPAHHGKGPMHHQQHPAHQGFVSPMQMHPMHHQQHPMHHQQHPMHHGNVAPMHMQHKPMPCKHCGCTGDKPPFNKNAMNMYDHMQMPKKPEYNQNGNYNNRNEYQNEQFDQPYSQMDLNDGFANPYPAPPGFQPFPTANFRDDEDDNNNE